MQEMTFVGAETEGRLIYELRTTLASGNHVYHFETSDGLETTRFPESEELSMQIDSPPSLGNTGESGYEYLVNPSTGDTEDVFTFRVKYFDPDDTAPSYVRVHIGNDAGRAMSYVSGNPQGGSIYTYSTSLPAGTHQFRFEASDGMSPARAPLNGQYSLVVTQSGNNLISNPGFESGSKSPWSHYSGGNGCGYAVSTAWVASGTYSYMTSDPGAGVACGPYQRISVAPGSSYRATAIVNAVSGVPQLYLQWRDASNNVISSVVDTHGGSGVETLEVEGQAPANARNVDVIVYQYVAGSGTAHVDDATLVITNNAPRLTDPGYQYDGSPGPQTPVTYYVLYTDPDGTTPAYVRLHVDGGTWQAMSWHSGDVATGAIYKLTRTLCTGPHDFYVSASDGVATTRNPTSGAIIGPTIGIDPAYAC
jgi:hypothetical protein